ncbi:MAG TPA: hypothetical protein VN047_17050, partial [Sphingopyxis sp.]|uniref:hypothetical protein n=1 Tax=Sphingopyxis sp. TaxID=1908224 RepID=UPI002C9716DE
WRRGGAGAAPAFQHRLAGRMTRPFAIANAIWRAGETPRTAGVMTGMASLFPPLVRMMSRATRIHPG